MLHLLLCYANNLILIMTYKSMSGSSDIISLSALTKVGVQKEIYIK